MVKASTLRTTAAVISGTVVVAAVAVGMGNQGLQSWRATQAASSDQWIAAIFRPLSLIGWRVSPTSGESTGRWLAPLVFNGVFLVLTILLTTLLERGRGPAATLVSVWSAVTTAGGLAGIAATPLVFAGTSQTPTALQYSQNLAYGLLTGFLVGLAAGIIAAIVSAPESARVRRDSKAQHAQTALGAESGAVSGSARLGETLPQQSE